MNEQKPEFGADLARAGNFVSNLLWYSVIPLRLYSRRLGTIGASGTSRLAVLIFPGVYVGRFVMLLVTEIAGEHSCLLAWRFAWLSCYVWIAHIVCYLYRHAKGAGVHNHYVGEPWFGGELLCDSTFAAAFALLAFLLNEPGFATWWILNIPLTAIVREMIRQRDSARQRQITSQMIEQRYWQSMVRNSLNQEEDFE
jgi:hypothetical protein